MMLKCVNMEEGINRNVARGEIWKLISLLMRLNVERTRVDISSKQMIIKKIRYRNQVFRNVISVSLDLYLKPAIKPSVIIVA